MGEQMDKKWSVKVEDMKELFHWDEPEGCLATDRIMVDGEKVGYMYREYPDFEGDSGWRFTCGDEDDEYMNNPKNSGIYELNSVANNDEDIIPLLDSPLGTAFYRDDSGKFVQDRFNILARQEIDEILYQHSIENKKDYKSRSPEEIAQMYEEFKIICGKYEISEDEVEEIIASIFGE